MRVLISAHCHCLLSVAFDTFIQMFKPYQQNAKGSQNKAPDIFQPDYHMNRIIVMQKSRFNIFQPYKLTLNRL